MKYKLATMGRNRRGLSFLKISARWEAVRLALIGAGFALAAVSTYLTTFSLIYWFSGLLLPEVNRSVVVFSTTLITLLLLSFLYEWSQRGVDRLFFPDTAHFKEKIEIICHQLAEITSREKLQQFLIREIPARLMVEGVYLHTEVQPETTQGLTLPLRMGTRSLGFLTIGPKRSRRSFGQSEQVTLKQLQEQISLVLSSIQLAEAREAAEKTDQLKINFLTNISHELRTPMNTVINSTGLVADGAFGEINEAQAEYLNQAVQGSEHLLKLLNDIFDITKIETGQLTLQPELINLGDVIEETLPMVKGMLQQKPVDLRVELATNLPPFMADRLRLRQILLNLLSNAIRFTQAGAIKVRAWLDDNNILVSVADTGIGIAPESLPLVFEDYRQLSGQPQRQFRFERRRQLGTGLGLSITKALVELHGGRIWVESEVGRGTTFSFMLPLSPAKITNGRKLMANGRQKVEPAKVYEG
ncbi:MAG: HAMP domain-containing histidine kinase [Anaerolineae bacterium]|nr:HAMP domain-containing histidine kinase [Anaerolineae bacterium]